MIIREINANDKNIYMQMSNDFYCTGAAISNISQEFHENSFNEAIKKNDYFKIFIFEDDSNNIIGYSILSMFYAKEFGGLFAFLDELFLTSESRNKGYATEYFNWLFSQYKNKLKGIRLEIAKDNTAAKRLYTKIGFKTLSYDQMYKLL